MGPADYRQSTYLIQHKVLPLPTIINAPFHSVRVLQCAGSCHCFHYATIHVIVNSSQGLYSPLKGTEHTAVFDNYGLGLRVIGSFEIFLHPKIKPKCKTSQPCVPHSNKQHKVRKHASA